MYLSSFPQVPRRFSCLPLPLLQAAVNEVHNNTQAPLELVLLSAISAASISVQGIADVQQPSGQIGPTSMMTLTVAKSGERKSTVEGFFFRPIRTFEEEFQQAYKKYLAEWDESVQVWEIKRGVLQKAVQAGIQKGRNTDREEEALRMHLRAKPIRPPQFKMLYENTTAPAMLLGLHRDFPFAGLVSSEGGSVLNSPAFHDLPTQNAIWSGDTVTIDRASAPSFRLSGARLTVSIMVQPSSMKTYIEAHGEEARGSGLWARFLVCQPVSTQGNRLVSNGTASWEHCNRFSQRVKDLLKKNVQAWEWGKEDRDIVKFSPEASENWLNYYNWVESQIRPGGRYVDAGDHASKLAENAGRLAAVLHYFEGFEGAVSKETLDAAIQICDAASQDFLSLFVPPPEEYRDAMVLSEYLSRLRASGYRSIAKNQVRQYCPNVLRSKARLDTAINVLCQQGQVAVMRLNKTYILNLYPQYPF